MNWSTIWELVKINLLYSNPQLLTTIRTKQSKKPEKNIKAYKSMMLQQGLLALVLGVLYSVIFFGIDFKQAPGLFTTYSLTFILISILNAFPAIFTVFYDSKDSQLYLPLPIKPGELLVAKTLSTLGMVISYLVPSFGLFALAYTQLTNPIIAIPLALINFILLTLLVLMLSIVFVNLLGSIIIKSPYKKLISTSLIVISQIIAFLGIMFINSNNYEELIKSGGQLASLPVIPVISGFYHIAAAPLSANTLLNYGALLVIIGILLGLIFKIIIPGYYRQLWTIDNGPKKVRQRQTKNHRSTGALLLRHHLSTLKIPALWSNVFLTSCLYLFFLSGMIASGSINFTTITADFFGTALLFGLLVGLTSTVLTMVGISLERDNYTFIKTLPINQKSFLIQKFLVLWGLQAGLPAIIYAIVGAFLGLHPLLILSMVVGILLASGLAGQFDYRKDFKNLTLNWQNVTQLLTRGNQNVIKGILAIVFLIAYSLLIAGSVILSFMFGALTVGLTIALITLLIAIPLQLYLYQNFWKTL